jgi:hypothetical protein
MEHWAIQLRLERRDRLIVGQRASNHPNQDRFGVSD